jgi:hypothetical protein
VRARLEIAEKEVLRLNDRSHELEHENTRLERIAKDQMEAIEESKSVDMAARQKLSDMAAQLEQVNAELAAVRAQASQHDQQLQRAIADHTAARQCVEKLESSLATLQKVRVSEEYL